MYIDYILYGQLIYNFHMKLTGWLSNCSIQSLQVKKKKAHKMKYEIEKICIQDN